MHFNFEKMYFEPTNKERSVFALQDIDRETAADLMSVLNGITHPGLDRLRKIIEHETSGASDRLFAEQRAEIEPCRTCHGVGRIRVGNETYQVDCDVTTCHVCKGEGSRVKIISVRYETTSEHWKNILAKVPGMGGK